MSLRTPESVRIFQTVLHAKAKGNPKYRFYSLYDKIYREDVIRYAWQQCRKNGGTAGVDGKTFEDIEATGVDEYLGKLSQELREHRYRTQAVRRVYIPKANGKKRPLGIPTIKDRIVQMAAVIVLGPIYEADMPDEQYGYRPKRSAHDAIRQIHRMVNQGYYEGVDADLKGYFESIPHRELMKSIARRVSDGKVLGLIKQWLQMPISEEKSGSGEERTNRNKQERRGVPQGAPISPLLSNIYMRRFVMAWKVCGLESRLKSRIVNYADDLVIVSKGKAIEALEAMRKIMGKLRLEVNEEKTHVKKIAAEALMFLGYRIGTCYRTKNGQAYIGAQPDKQRVQRICLEAGEITGRGSMGKKAEEIVGKLNNVLRGWANYFSLGAVSKAYRAIDAHVRNRLRRWLCRKHKIAGTGTGRYPDEKLYGELGLIRLAKMTATFPWAKA